MSSHLSPPAAAGASASAGHAGAKVGSPGGVLWFLGLLLTAAVLWLARDLLVPFLFAAIVAYFLNPLVMRLQERGVKRGFAVIALFVALVGGTALLVVLLAPGLRVEAEALYLQFPGYARDMEAALEGLHRELVTAMPAAAKAIPAPGEPGWLMRSVEGSTGKAASVLGQAGTLLFTLILIPIFAFFLLKDGPRALDWIVARIHPRHIETSVAVWAEIDRIVGRYLRGLTMESAGVAILATGGLWILGVPFPLVLGLFAGLVNPVPYLGALLSLSAASLVALASQMGLAKVGAIVVLFVTIRLIDDFVLIPVTIGGAVHLHPMLVIVSILVGEHAFGVLGMVLAVPLVTVVKEIARLLLEHRRTLRRQPSGPLAHVPI